ncbi:MAG: PAS domain-containing protein [Gracilimonas sp.]|nr:PAS domain-containing protein [Gracilimonas sp.]
MAISAYWKWHVHEDSFELGSSFWVCLKEKYPEHFSSPGKAEEFFYHTVLDNVKESILQAIVRSENSLFSIYTKHQLTEPAQSISLKWSGETFDSKSDTQKPGFIIGEVTLPSPKSSPFLQIPNNPEYYQQLMDNLPDSVFFKDLESRFIAINKICAKKFGLKEQSQAVGKTDFDFFNLSHAQQAFEDEQKIIKTGKPIIHKIEKEVYKEEGNERTWTSTSKLPLYDNDGSIIGTYGISTDITAQKKAQIQNKRLRSQLFSLFDSDPNMLFVKDWSGKYAMINKAKADFHELSKDEIIGKTDLEIGVDKSNAATYLKTDRHVIAQNESIHIPEDSVTDSHGQITWYETIKVPFQLLDSGEKATLSIVMDITESKKREMELNKTLDIISHQNQRLSNFTHIVSHNLRNHAGSISMILELITLAESEAERDESFDQLKIASNRLTETINDLNEIIDQQYKDSDIYREVNIKEFADNTIQILTHEIKAKNATFNLDIPENLSFSYNPVYLESILLNLFSNAIKYSHPDRKPQIHVKAFENSECVHLEVEDNGRGIDLRKHGDQLFGMYETFHNNDNAKGIGLYITKNQIESMGGKINVESDPGKGTIFKIRLN